MIDDPKRVEMLMHELLDAFSEVPYPGDDDLIRHSCGECLEIRDFFRKLMNKSRWNEYRLKVAANAPEFVFLSPEGFHYFLPLLAQAVLADPNTDVGPSLVFTFDDDFARKDDDRIALLTERQRAVMVKVFEHINDMMPEDYRDEIPRIIKNLREGSTP